MKRLAVALVAAMALLAGCGNRQQQTTASHPATLRVAPLPASESQAGLYAAQGTGELSLSGLAVSLLPPASPDATLTSVAQGRADLAVTTAGAVLQARTRGLAVTSVAAIARGASTAAVAAAGRSPAAGYGGEVVLAAPTAKLAADGDLVRSFLGALVRATRRLKGHDRAAVAAATAANPALRGPGLTRALPLLEPPAGQPLGYHDPAAWQALAAAQHASAAGAFTNAYLPGAGA